MGTQKRSQVTVFAKGEQILFMQCVDFVVGIVGDDLLTDDYGKPLVSCSEAIEGEASRIEVSIKYY